MTIYLLWSEAGVTRGAVTAPRISLTHGKERWGDGSVESAIHVRTHGITANTLAGAITRLLRGKDFFFDVGRSGCTLIESK